MGATSAIWHDVECGAYAADLALWEELADEADGSILDLGCGTGRVALHLARRGHEVMGLDLDPTLVAAFNERADGWAAGAEVGDARDFAIGREFPLIIAPMQLIQLFSTRAERISLLTCLASHLCADSRAALTIAEEVLGGRSGGEGHVPDVREVDGCVYSSMPLETAVDAELIVVRRSRKTVSPAGVLTDEMDEVQLRVISVDVVEQEAAAAGMRAAGRRRIPATDLHVGSTVVLLEREC